MSKIDCMQKICIFSFLFFYSIIFSQSVELLNPADQRVYGSEQLFCTGETFDLKVDAIASSTGDYAMTSVFASDFSLSAGSIPIQFPGASSNIFSEAFPIGFNFSFYGKTYIKLVLGSNGRLVFTNSPELENLKDKTTYKDRTFSGIAGYNTFATLPSMDYNKIYQSDPGKTLDMAQIFFGYTDLVDRSVNSSIDYKYSTVMVGTTKGLLVSFQNQIRTNGTGGISSAGYESYILILADGRIVIYVNNKSETNYNAILGIQNDNATKFKVPDHSTNPFDYNNGKWKSEGKAWLFTPNQNLTPKFKWFQNSTLLSETSSALMNFTPNDGDVLKVEVSYFDDANVQVGATVSDEVLFEKLVKPVITYTSAACVTGVTLNVVNDPNLSYQWFRVGSTNVLETGNSVYALGSDNYYVRATRKVSPACSIDSDPVEIDLSSTIPIFNVNDKPLKFCATDGSLTNTINLYDYYAPNPAKYTLYFIDGVTQVLDPTNFIIQANTTTVVGIFVNDPISGCTINQNFNIRFDSLPVSVTNLSKRFCFGSTKIDVTQYLQEIAGVNFSSFDYQYSIDGINYSNNTIVNPQQFQKVWVKILPQNPLSSTCEIISTIVFVEDAQVIANAPVTQLPPQCASATQTFDLESLIPEINPDPNVKVTFHRTLTDAENGVGAVAYQFRSGMGSTTLFVRVIDNVTGCVSPDYPQFTVLVYNKPTLLKSSITKTNCAGNTIFDLTQIASDLTDAASPVVVKLAYYSTNGTLLSGSQITKYNSNINGDRPYVEVIYNTTCSERVYFNLTLNPKPVANTLPISICTETTYSLADFKNKVIANSSNYTFTDLSGNPLPASFDLSILPLVVNFLMKDNTTGCISDPQTISFVRGSTTAILRDINDYEVCDTDFDGITSFNLDAKKSSFTTDATAVFEYFKDVTLTQSIPATYTNETAFAQTIYLRVTIPGFCPIFAKLHLIVNTPTKSTTLLNQYQICFGETRIIDGGLENVSWKWSTGETSRYITLNKIGNYSVELTNAKGCTYTHQFSISDDNQPKIQVVNQTANSLEVIATGGTKPYRYYFNGVAQSSNILQNPTDASYIIQVESSTGCIGAPKTVYFIKINNTFTPNGDGINDYWTIENLDQMEKVSIVIVDRSGMKVFDNHQSGLTSWDGKQNGRALQTSTYWYVVSWFDPSTLKTEQRTGWVLLKNRN